MEAATPAEDATYFKNREAKQDYLKKEIIDKGYDTADFAQFLLDQKGIVSLILTLGENHFLLLAFFYQTTHFVYRERDRDRQLDP
jgi:hypothetical protein